MYPKLKIQTKRKYLNAPLLGSAGLARVTLTLSSPRQLPSEPPIYLIGGSRNRVIPKIILRSYRAPPPHYPETKSQISGAASVTCRVEKLFHLWV